MMGKMEQFIRSLEGSYDNFLQVWKEQTEDAIHRDEVDQLHQHVHVKCKPRAEYGLAFDVEYYSGRNNETQIRKTTLRFTQDENEQYALSVDEGEKFKIHLLENGFETELPFIKLSDNVLEITDQGVYEKNKGYRLLRCRYFSGWFQYPDPSDPETELYLRNLEIHDQGGMTEVHIADQDYTVELTQLIFAHKIDLMKIAIYDVPMKEVGINSKAISYAWTSPDAKRLGINLRKIISGWTYIEQGFLSSNNLNS